jgi:hypothetical protein
MIDKSKNLAISSVIYHHHNTLEPTEKIERKYRLYESDHVDRQHTLAPKDKRCRNMK